VRDPGDAPLTTACPSGRASQYWSKPKGCHKGDACTFAHGAAGAAAPRGGAPAAGGDGVCREFARSGACADRANCPFAHPAAAGGGGGGGGRGGGGRGRGSAPARGRGAAQGGRGAAAATAASGERAPPTAAAGGLTLFYFLRGYGAGTALTSPHAMRKFVQAAAREADMTARVSDLGGAEGLARLRQLEAAADRVALAPHGVRGPPERQPVSFLLTWVPLLRLISERRFSDSCLSARVTPVFATLATPRVCAALVRCLEALLAAGAVNAGAAEADQVWSPTCWLDVLAPVAAFALKAVGLNRALAVEPSFCALADALGVHVDAWQARAPLGAASLRALRDDVRAAAAPVRAARDAAAAATERADAAAAAGARERVFSRARGAAAAAAAAPPDGPGALSARGPRHDNDSADFRAIRIGPTEAEVLATRAPYLPANVAGFAHHAGASAADALLDTHFRLLRHDLLAPLLDSAAALQHVQRAGGGAGAGGAPLRGNRLLASKLAGGGGRDVADLFAFRALRVLALRSVSAGADRGTRAGLHYVLEFDQPGASGKGKKARSGRELEAYWTASRRLQRGALLCVWVPPALPGGAPQLVFCTAAERGDGGRSPVALLCHSGTRARLGVAPCGPVFNAALVALAAQQDATHSAAQECLLLEASDSFFAYEPVLRALQLMDASSLPFQGYLLPPPAAREGAAAQLPPPQMLPPAYLSATTTYDLRCLAKPGAPAAARDALRAVRVADGAAFPRDALREATTLDEPQLDAICAALSSEVSLIQGAACMMRMLLSVHSDAPALCAAGPPGTGKTYVGVQVMRLLLRNCANHETAAAAAAAVAGRGDDDSDDDDADDDDAGMRARFAPRPAPAGAPDVGPILCVCFTNHALDQFLEALLDTGCVSAAAGALVRVGGRSKSERLEAHNLLALARAPGVRTKAQGRLMYAAMDEVRDCDRVLAPLLNAAVGGADTLTWADVDDFLCVEFPAAWEAFREELEDADGFTIAGAKKDKDVLQRWLAARDLAPAERAPPAAAEAAAAEARAAASAAATANRFAQLELGDAAAATTRPQKPKPKPNPKDAAAAPPPPPPPPPPEEVISAARLAELLDIARDGRCIGCGLGAECVCDAERTFELWSFTAGERRALALSWHASLRAVKLADLEAATARYEAAQQRLDEAHADVKLNVLRSARVVGMTTTGVASNQRLIAALGPRVVIVEEAAEVMEAHILSALSPRTQHLILIGDHRQLRPKTQVYTLSVDSGRGYNLDVSLFERLAAAQPCPVPLVTLAEQWRMRPEVAELVRRTIYPQLRDAPAVLRHPPVRGVRQPLFFIDHDHPEAGEEEEAGAPSGSKQNANEARFVVALTKHLLHQGYKPNQIAVLTPYVGQLKRLRLLLSAVTMVFVDESDEADLQKEADKDGSSSSDDDEADAAAAPVAAAPAALGVSQLLNRVRLATVDNFQGEEAQVVIISLVRNNAAGRIGFLSTPNRANVLLSRAQHGMYIVGNARTFRNARPAGGMWAQVIDIMEAQGRVGRALSLCCANHPEEDTSVSSPEDFAALAGDGGCARACGFRLPCGHTCARRCHPDDRAHAATACRKPCMRGRACGHPCDAECSAPCPPCPTHVDATLPCGHVASIACWQSGNLGEVRCIVPVQRAGGACGHTLTLPCHRAGELEGHPERCSALCALPLPGCGHACEGRCGGCRGPLVLPQPPALQHPPCAKPCGDNLMCGHACKAACHKAGGTPCAPCAAPCAVKCEHSACSKPCAEACAPCAEPCGWACEHGGACAMPCGAPCDRLPCDARCERTLPCGHRCPSLCGEPCPPPERCCRLCASPARATDTVDLIMFTSLAEHDPDESPLLALSCGHVFTLETLDAHTELAKQYERDAGSGAWLHALPAAPQFAGACPSCPSCRAPLRGVRRYGRALNHAAAQQAEKKFMLACATRLAAAEELLRSAATAPEWRARRAVAERARTAFQAVLRACQEPPTVKLHLACLAAAHRAELPTAQLPVPAPDAQSRCRALLGFASANTARMVHTAAGLCEEPRDAPPAAAGGGRGRGRGGGARSKSAPAPPTLRQLDEAADAATASIELALALAQERQLHATCGRAHAALATHLTQRVAERLRVRDGGRGGGIDAAGIAQLRQLLDRAAAEARAAIDGAAGQYTHSAPDIVAAAEAVLARVPQLEASFETKLSNDEARMVFQAMGFADGGFTGAGHWFQCLNGHPYLIADCGGATMESRCPECGEGIGGGGHRLRDDNAQATAFRRQAGID
jgi:hypothetical protein